MHPRTRCLGFLLVPITLLACGPAEPPGERIASNKQRLAPSAPADDVTELVLGNAGFGGALYRELRDGDQNLIVSPYSVSVALAMTYAGARGETEAGMAKALSFTLPSSRLHPAFNSLDQALASRGQGAQGKDGKPFRLTVVNQLFGQKGHPFLPEYLDLIAENYGAGLRGMDFIRSPDPSRKAINDWAEARTEGLIKDLLPEGAVSTDTRLVLANAVYFNAAWKQPFEKSNTAPGDFHLRDGAVRSVQMMRNAKLRAGVAETDDYVAVDLPYDGGEVAMLLVLPKTERFGAVESQLSGAFFEGVTKKLNEESLELTLPRFTVSGKKELKEPLSKLGMAEAFGNADFSGIDGARSLVITDVFHEAVVIVDEEGTEAAAVTAVLTGETAAGDPKRKIRFDRPFLFAIRDVQTGAVLFLGRVLAP